MAQIPPFKDSAYIVQRKKEREGEQKSRGGVSSPNPPSTNLPASVHLEGPLPPPMPGTGTVPYFDPMGTPRDALAARTVNNAVRSVSISIDLTDRDTPATSAGLPIVERAINESTEGGKPRAMNVIARDGKQVITNDMPGNPDHL